MARPELVQQIARLLNNVGAAGVTIGAGVSLAYSALFTGVDAIDVKSDGSFVCPQLFITKTMSLLLCF
jgi:hypothetical protein